MICDQDDNFSNCLGLRFKVKEVKAEGAVEAIFSSLSGLA